MLDQILSLKKANVGDCKDLKNKNIFFQLLCPVSAFMLITSRVFRSRLKQK